MSGYTQSSRKGEMHPSSNNPRGGRCLWAILNAGSHKNGLRAHFLILVIPQWDQVSAEVFDLLLPFLHSFTFIQDGLPESNVAASNNMYKVHYF